MTNENTDNTLNSNQTQLSNENLIKTPQVLSLLALEIAIIISWIAYHEYQPVLIEQFNLSEYSFILLIVQGIILTLTPIVAGYISDKVKIKNGEMIPVVNFGISATAMIFMSVAITIFSEPTGLLRFILPFLIVLWLISMNIFRSPAISLIEYFVPQKDIPKVFAYFVVAGNIGYALEPVIVDLVRYFGGTLTFIVGAVLVFGTGKFLMNKTNLINPTDLSSDFNNDTQDGKSNFLVVLLSALSFGLITSLLFKVIPNHFDTNNISLFGFDSIGKILSSVIIIVSAIVTIIISRKVKNEQIEKLLYISTLISLGLIYFILQTNSQNIIVLLSLLLSIFYAMVSLTALPTALFRLGTRNTVLGLGVFFGAMEFVDSIFEILAII